MTKFKLFFLIAIVVGILGGGIYLIQEQLRSGQVTIIPDLTCQEANGITWCQDSGRNFNLALFSLPLQTIFTSENAQSLREQSLVAGYELAINGGFFKGSYVSAEYAGLLQIKGEMLAEIARNDKQVTHVIVYDEKNDLIEFLPASDFDTDNYAEAHYTLLQAGPLIIQENEITTDLIAGSQNGEAKYNRTLLGYTDTGEKFVIITRTTYTLSDLGEVILGLEIFSDKVLHVVNLDGGSSTAMFSKEYDQFSFGETKRLPSIIAVGNNIDSETTNSENSE